ncbi:MAG: YggT family protein [Legionellales bacterium]|nr:YggT family protein [Legionellales bacterium]
MQSINMAIVFLTNIIFDLYIYILLLRLILPIIRADYHNPLSQLAINLTEPVIKPLKNFIPNINYINIRVILLLLLVTNIKLLILIIMQYHTLPNFIGLFIWSIGEVLDLAVNLMFMAILIVVILSWIGQNVANSIVVILFQITEPYLSIFRRWIPPISGLDLSPIAALIVLKLITIVLVHPIKQLGFGII